VIFCKKKTEKQELATFITEERVEKAAEHSDDNAIPVWNFCCVREIENEARERVERMGVIPAFDEDMNSWLQGMVK
jgi:hypothetical protein